MSEGNLDRRPSFAIDRRALLRSAGGALGLAALAPIFTACGGDGDDTGNAGTGGQTATGSTGAAAVTNLAFQLSWLPNAQTAGEFVALDKGYFRDAGLDVELLAGGPDVSGVTLLAAGQMPVAVSFQANTLLARSQGVPVQAFAATLQRAPLTYFSFERYGISEITDFAGKTFGIPPDGEPFLRALLEANGMSIDDVTIQRAGAQAAAALFENRVDVIGAWDIDIGQIAPILAEDDVVAFSLYDHGMRQQSNLYLATEETIATETNMLAALLEAASAGWEYAADNPSEAIEILGRVAGVDVDVENETAALEATIGYVFNDYTAEHGWGALDTSVWSAAIDIFDEYDMLDQPVTVDEAVNMSVLDAATDRVKRG